MASNIANHNITEFNINASLQSEDGRINVYSNGQGVASINVKVDRGAAGVVGAITANPLAITFPAEIPADIDDMSAVKYADMDRAPYQLSPVVAIPIDTITIDKVPGFPINLTTEFFEVTALDDAGVPMIASLLSNGTITGDVDSNVSSYDTTTGQAVIKWNRILQQGQIITYKKNYTMPPAAPMIVTLADLVPITTVKTYTVAAQTADANFKHTPVAPETVMITAHRYDGKVLEIHDDGHGKLIGDVDVSSNNFINYDTGEINITFNDDLDVFKPIMIHHASLVKIREYRPSQIGRKSHKPVRLKFILDWTDLCRIVDSVRVTTAAAENGLKYRANT